MQDDITRHGQPTDDIESPILSIPRARQYLGDMGQSTFYEKMKEGEVEVVRLGGRTFITRKSLDAYIVRNTRPSRPETKAKQLKPHPEKRRLTPGKQRRIRNDERRAAP